MEDTGEWFLFKDERIVSVNRDSEDIQECETAGKRA